MTKKELDQEIETIVARLTIDLGDVGLDLHSVVRAFVGAGCPLDDVEELVRDSLEATPVPLQKATQAIHEMIASDMVTDAKAEGLRAIALASLSSMADMYELEEPAQDVRALVALIANAIDTIDQNARLLGLDKARQDKANLASAREQASEAIKAATRAHKKSTIKGEPHESH